MARTLTLSAGSYDVKVADRVTAAERAGLLRFLSCETGVFRVIGATSVNDVVVPVKLGLVAARGAYAVSGKLAGTTRTVATKPRGKSGK